MTQGFLIISFFVLSWKWYLFGAFLWAHYFWHRRKHQVTAGASEIDVRHTGRNACQLGITLGAFHSSFLPLLNGFTWQADLWRVA
jgi:hypothetical protein